MWNDVGCLQQAHISTCIHLMCMWMIMCSLHRLLMHVIHNLILAWTPRSNKIADFLCWWRSPLQIISSTMRLIVHVTDHQILTWTPRSDKLADFLCWWNLLSHIVPSTIQVMVHVITHLETFHAKLLRQETVWGGRCPWPPQLISLLHDFIDHVVDQWILTWTLRCSLVSSASTTFCAGCTWPHIRSLHYLDTCVAVDCNSLESLLLLKQGYDYRKCSEQVEAVKCNKTNGMKLCCYGELEIAYVFH